MTTHTIVSAILLTLFGVIPVIAVIYSWSRENEEARQEQREKDTLLNELLTERRDRLTERRNER